MQNYSQLSVSFECSHKTVLIFGKYLAVSSPPPPPRYIMLKVEILHARVQRCLWGGGGGETLVTVSALKSISIDVITLC